MTELPADPHTREDEAVRDLLGALSYAQLSGFVALAADSQMAPDLVAKTAFGRMAVSMFSRFEQVGERLRGLGMAQELAMAPFVGQIDGYHARTAPSDWIEGIVKTYVGDGIVRDFYRELATHLRPADRDFVVGLIGGAGQAETIVGIVRAAIDGDSRTAARLALWGRRIMGEAVQQCQSVAGERDSLTALLIGGEPGSDVAEMGRMFGRIGEAHTARMQTLGLAS